MGAPSQYIQYLTKNRLSSVTSQDDIAKIIQNVDSSKAHGDDNIRSIRMLKIFGSAIYKPLAILFKQCVDTGIFPSEWKQGNFVPIYKKGDRQALKSYRPVSLLFIFGKILERLMFNKMLKLFIENELTKSVWF